MITASMVKELREKSGAGMLDCKKALEATEGNMESAIDWLRETGICKAAKKADRIAAEGVVEAGVRSTTIIWALCPTDYYEEAREKWLSDDEYALIREKVDYYMNARANFEENLYALMDTGAQAFDIVCYSIYRIIG